jgi:hypothetical protein
MNRQPDLFALPRPEAPPTVRYRLVDDLDLIDGSGAWWLLREYGSSAGARTGKRRLLRQLGKRRAAYEVVVRGTRLYGRTA